MSKLALAFIALVGCTDDPELQVFTETSALTGVVTVPGLADAVAPYSGSPCSNNTSSPNLCTTGGPTLSKAQIQALWWGPSSYQSHIDGYYTALGKQGAGYLGLLAEYGISSAYYAGSVNLNNTITRTTCSDGTQCEIVPGDVALRNLTASIANGALLPNEAAVSYYPMHFPDNVWVTNEFNSGNFGLPPNPGAVWHASIDCEASPKNQFQIFNGGLESGLPSCSFNPSVAPPWNGNGCWGRHDVNTTTITHHAHSGTNAARLINGATMGQRLLVAPCGLTNTDYLTFWAAAQSPSTAPTLQILAETWVWDTATQAVVTDGWKQKGAVTFSNLTNTYAKYSIDITPDGGLWTDFRFAVTGPGDATVDLDDIAVLNVDPVGVVAYGILHQTSDHPDADVYVGHEAIEAMTDPYWTENEVAYANTNWGSGGEEIGDVCEHGPGSWCMVDPNSGNQFRIEPAWSNTHQACIVMTQPTSCP